MSRGRFRHGKRVTVRLDPDLVGFVERFRAEQGGVTFSEALRRIVYDYREHVLRGPRFYRIKRPVR